MSKQRFKDFNFRSDTLAMIIKANEVIRLYQASGLRLTCRQLYYQFVTRNWLPNTEKSYKRLLGIVSDGRLAGMIDWNAIEDRGRVPQAKSEFADLQELTEAALRSYRLPRWEGQKNYVELWVEKQALAGVLWPLAAEFHVTLMVNKGYSSQSAMYDSAQRFLGACECEGSLVKQPVLLYLGDHDPSGEDMVRDIRDRLVMFGVESIDVRKVALTMEQIEEYNPPPNPAKMSDSRAAAYVEKHGEHSWEVDALPPDVLSQLIRDAFTELHDADLMAEMVQREDADKERLREAVKELVSP